MHASKEIFCGKTPLLLKLKGGRENDFFIWSNLSACNRRINGAFRQKDHSWPLSFGN